MGSQKDFTVAIVGGGIVGLICAIGLARAGIQVDIFESASKYGDIGAGVGIGPNAVRVLKNMGLLDDIRAHSEDSAPPTRPFTFIMGEDPHTVVYEYPESDEQAFSIHRAAFLNALASILPDSVHSHFSKRCTAVRAAVDGSDRACLRFADGSTYEADVVIGADGIKSVIRTQIFGSGDDHLVDTGASAYRGQVHTKDLLDAGLKEETLRSPLLWMGTDKHLVTYPIMDGSLLNVAACPLDYTRAKIPISLQASWPAWVMKVTQQEMLDAFIDFGHDARIILEQLKEPSKWTMHGLYPPLESYVAPAKFESGVGGEGTEDNQNRLIGNMNVVLIGDAAHAMLPFLGAGAGAGIEDAYTYSLACSPIRRHAMQTSLCVLPSTMPHPKIFIDLLYILKFVLRAYDSIRVPRAAYIAEKSRRAGEVLHGRGPSGPSVAGRWNDIESQWDKIWNTDVKVDVANAVAALEEGGVFDSQELITALG